MNCPRCNAQIPEGARICPNCGSPIQSADQKSAKPKKPIYKKWWFWVIIVFVFLVLISLFSPHDSSEGGTDQSIPSETTVNEVETTQASEQDADKEAAKKSFAEAMGTSTITFSESVRNDAGGNFRLTRLASSEDILDHAIEYYNAYIKNDTEVHFVINSTLKTTARISASYNYLFVDEYEYVDNEEHDAKTLLSGLPLGSYIVHIDTGEIEDLSKTVNDSGEVIELKSLEASILDAIPKDYYSETWSYVELEKLQNDTVRITIQIDLADESDDKVQKAVKECFDSANNVMTDAGVHYEMIDIMVVNNGDLIGIYSSENGTNFSLLKDGKQTDITLS